MIENFIVIQEFSNVSLEKKILFVIDSHGSLYSIPIWYRFISSDLKRIEKLNKQNVKLINNNLFEKIEDGDVTFLVKGEKIPAHKSVISASCKFFENMFASMKSISP